MFLARRRRAAVVAAALLVTLLPAQPSEATHPPGPPIPPVGDRLVHVGGGDLRRDLDTNVQVQLMAFYPEVLKVHRGETVEWRWPSGYAAFHTVTFSPADMDVAAAPEPVEAAHPPVHRVDEAPGVIALDESMMLGSECGRIHPDGANGRAAEPPCHIRSTGQLYGSSLSDGFFNVVQAQPQSFAAKIDLPPGRYRYHCTWHPSMHGYIEVVDDSVPVPSNAEVEAASREQLAADVAAAEALQARLSVPTSRTDGDRRIWTVHVGASEGHVSINDYLPAHLELDPGDGVEFVVGSSESQTVTFPAEAIGSFTLEGCDTNGCKGDFLPVGLVATAFPWACEYDDPATGAPAAPAWLPRVGCPDGSKVEWQMSAYTSEQQRLPGDAVLTSRSFHNSGWLAPADAPDWYRAKPVGGGAWWPSTFAASFPAEGTFRYGCLIHPGGMEGTIRVGAS